MMEKKECKGDNNSVCDRWSVIRPLTRHNIYSYYVPMSGTISYYAFSLHVSLRGGLIRYFPNNYLRIANCMLFNSHIGVGMYLYMRPHMRQLKISNRIIYSAFGSIIFNFGSILLWATTKSILPDKTWMRIVFAIIASFGFITIGKEYIQMIDNLV